MVRQRKAIQQFRMLVFRPDQIIRVGQLFLTEMSCHALPPVRFTALSAASLPVRMEMGSPEGL